MVRSVEDAKDGLSGRLERELKEKEREKKTDMRFVLRYLETVLDKVISEKGVNSIGDVSFEYNDLFDPEIFSKRVYKIIRGSLSKREIESELLKMYKSGGWKCASVDAEKKHNWHHGWYKGYSASLSPREKVKYYRSICG